MTMVPAPESKIPGGKPMQEPVTPPQRTGLATIDPPATVSRRIFRTASPAKTSELTIIIPTRNESPGVERLLERLATSMRTPTTVLFVDDSDDGTAYRVQTLAAERRWGQLDIELIHRPPSARSGGLGSAVCEGLRRAESDWVIVMDADLQHPPEAIARMVEAAAGGQTDLVIGSRFTGLGDTLSSESLSPTRQHVTRACLAAAHTAFPRRLSGITDPLSGFFMLRRKAVDPELLKPDGFKILLEILGRNPRLRVSEIGFRFDDRHAGVSKASLKEGARFARQLGRLRLRSRISYVRDRYRYRYAIHDLLTVESDTELPELLKFRVRSLANQPTLRVTVDDGTSTESADLLALEEARPEIRYTESVGRTGFAMEVTVGDTTEIRVSSVVGHSPHVLYTNVVEPIIRWKLVESGTALVHAACFTTGDRAHLITARTDTGKTTTMLKVLDHSACEFVSDDLCLITADGQVRSYPKPLTISNHTVHALTGAELTRMERFTLPLQSRLHSKAGRQFAFLIAGKSFPVATLNAVVQRLIPPPKYHVERLVPGVKTHGAATIASLFIIERSDHEGARMLGPEEALTILLENCEDAYGFPPYEELETLLHSISPVDLRAKEKAIIASALESVPSSLLSSTTMGWAEAILDAVSPAALDA